MEIDMTGEIDTDEIVDEVRSQLETEIEGQVESLVDQNMSNMDLTDHFDISDYIDYFDIRYNIEDDILSQVNENLDYDEIRMNIEDEILSYVSENLDVEFHSRLEELEELTASLLHQIQDLQNRPSLIRRFINRVKVVLGVGE